MPSASFKARLSPWDDVSAFASRGLYRADGRLSPIRYGQAGNPLRNTGSPSKGDFATRHFLITDSFPLRSSRADLT